MVDRFCPPILCHSRQVFVPVNTVCRVRARFRTALRVHLRTEVRVRFRRVVCVRFQRVLRAGGLVADRTNIVLAASAARSSCFRGAPVDCRCVRPSVRGWFGVRVGDYAGRLSGGGGLCASASRNLRSTPTG